MANKRNCIQSYYSTIKNNVPNGDDMLLAEIAINLPDEKVYVKKNHYNQLFSLLSENNIKSLIDEKNNKINASLESKISTETAAREEAINQLKTEIDGNDVIVKGDTQNSAILNGEYQGYKNTAISQTSIAVGAAVSAGLKGYYYNHVNISENKVFLTVNQPTTLSNTSIVYPDNNFTDNLFECAYNVGDTISIVFNKKYENYTTITSISGNVITLSEIPFTTDDFTLGIAKVVATTPDEFSFYSVKREVNLITNEVTFTNYNKGDVDLGGGAHAEGVNSAAANIGAHAEGIQTLGDGQAAHAEGIMTQAVYAAHAEGFKTIASGHDSHAEGNQTIASGQDAHAEGKETVASGIQSHAEGQYTQAQGSQSHTEGESSVAKGNQSHAEGYSTLSEGVNSHAEGESTQALGKDSHAEGFQTVAKGAYTHAEGYNAIAYGTCSHAEGFSSLKLEDIDAKSGGTYEEKWDSLENAEKFNMAFGKQSHVEGNGNIAVGNRGHAEGIFTKALGTNSHAEGQQTTSEGIASHAEGFNTHAKGKGSHVSGIGTITSNDGEFACGQYNDSIVNQTIFSIGNGTNIGDIVERTNIFEITKDKILFKGENIGVIKKYDDNGIVLIDTNNTNIANGLDSFAAGNGTIAGGSYAFSMGLKTNAKGNASFAGGSGTETTGAGSFAFGQQCKALKNRSVAMGYQCESSGFQSFAMGRGIKTTNNDEFSCGKYNYSDPSKGTLFSVGHGPSDTERRNLIEANNTDDGYGEVIIQSHSEYISDGSSIIKVGNGGVEIDTVEGDVRISAEGGTGEYGSDRSSIVVNYNGITLRHNPARDNNDEFILKLNSSGLYYNDDKIITKKDLESNRRKEPFIESLNELGQYISEIMEGDVQKFILTSRVENIDDDGHITYRTIYQIWDIKGVKYLIADGDSEPYHIQFFVSTISDDGSEIRYKVTTSDYPEGDVTIEEVTGYIVNGTVTASHFYEKE